MESASTELFGAKAFAGEAENTDFLAPIGFALGKLLKGRFFVNFDGTKLVWASFHMYPGVLTESASTASFGEKAFEGEAKNSDFS